MQRDSSHRSAFNSTRTMSIARREVLIILSLAITGDARAQVQSTWYAVRGIDHSFVVDMPGEPIYKVIDTRSSGGAAFAYHSYSLEYRRLSFVVQTALYPADVDVRQPK